ncbi:MAG TPA: hypothetical protein VNE38_19740 [Ktedonobacteraceae bacterium]|nr:hypothetical protein [Ktedonobacteraceae bacterium]
MSDELQQRLDVLLYRLRTAYDGIGHSSGRPYVYFVYPPEQERAIQRLVDEQLRSDSDLTFHHLDLLPLTMQSLAGQEERRQQLLTDPLKTSSVTEAIMRLWARAVSRNITSRLEAPQPQGRHPVVALRGLAALHPLGNPTTLMEFLAEHEPRHPGTHTIVPIVLLIPGTRPPQTSRRYLFLGQERLRLDFYRGEEM